MQTITKLLGLMMGHMFSALNLKQNINFGEKAAKNLLNGQKAQKHLIFHKAAKLF